MGAYKKLNKQDAFITTYTAHKSWAVSGSSLAKPGITVQTAGTKYTLPSLQQLYYRDKNSDGSIPSHSFDVYNQTTLFYSSSRNLVTGSQIISIPRQLYGTNIQPGTFRLTIPALATLDVKAIQVDYVKSGYVQDLPAILVETPNGALKQLPIGPLPADNYTYIFIDDAEGNLYLSGSNVRTKVGDIIYPHGMAIITNPTYWPITNAALFVKTSSPGTVSWKSTQPIFTHNYHCRIRESEYNFTYNPTALSSSLGIVYNNDQEIYNTSGSISKGDLNSNVTGSSFQPYITTVGLYNDANELIAVGKMGQPVPKPANTEMTIIVKIDI